MELFENIKRPRAEMKVITQFITKYETAKKAYKLKAYEKCLIDFNECVKILIPIKDMIPKCKMSYFLMKTKYKCCFYQDCKAEISILDNLSDKIDKDSLLYFKAKAKSFLYQMLCNFILNQNKESIANIINLIEAFKSLQYDAESRAILFWIFLKGFLGEADLNKTLQFDHFKEYYDVLRDEAESKQINSSIKEQYKVIMNTNTRQLLFDKLNGAFFLHKYNLITNKVIGFLDKYLPPYAREDNLGPIRQKLQNYIELNKIDIREAWGTMSIKDIIFEQRNRIVGFDLIFGNICGAFNVIFNEFFFDKPNDKNAAQQTSTNRSVVFEKLPTLRVIDPEKISKLNKYEQTVTEQNTFIKPAKTIQLTRSNEPFAFNIPNNALPKKCATLSNPNFDFSRDIVIPSNLHTEEIPYVRATQGTKGSLPRLNFPSKRITPVEYNNTNTNKNRRIQTSPLMTNTMDKKLALTQMELDHHTTTQNSDKTQYQPVILRNVNTFLFNTIMKNFENPVHLRKKDLGPIKIPNYIKSYHGATEKGSSPSVPNMPPVLTENQDAFFSYENFMLIKNFYMFGVCDGHGKYGKQVADAASILFPSNLLYLIIDDNLIKRKERLNEIVISLFKIEEKPEVKEVNILKYFLIKFDFDYEKTTFVKQSLQPIIYEINEAIARTHVDCKERKKIDAETSGCTLCSILIYGRTLYSINVGDSRAVIGSHIFDENRWEVKALTVEHKPETSGEAKRIAGAGGRVSQAKSETGQEVGPFRVWGKSYDSTTPGLAMSRTIGDNQAKKIGVSYIPTVTEYELKSHDNIIIIASDGIWEYISNKEAIAVCSVFYENKKRAEEASLELLRYAQTFWKKKNIRAYDDITCIVIFLDVKD